MVILLDYVHDTASRIENVNGVNVRVFEVPPNKYFARGEITYLSLILDIDERVLIEKINEIRLGRKIIDKLFAYRYDKEPWTLERLTLPDLMTNDVQASEEEPRDDIVLSAWLHVNGIQNFVKIVVFQRREFREVVINRVAGYRGIVKYIVYI